MTIPRKWICALCAVAVLALYAGCESSGEGKAELGATKKGFHTVLKENVAITTATQVELPKTIWLTGSLEADSQSDVAAKRGGIVNKVFVDRGSIVKKNDVLVQLDTTDAVNDLDQAQATAAELLVRLGLKSTDEKFDPSKQPDVNAAKAAYDLAKSNYDRDKSLADSKIISTEEFERTRNAFNTAQQAYQLAVAEANQLFRKFQTALIAVKTARQHLVDMTVKAPFDGAIVNKLVTSGESVNSGEQVVDLVQINPLRLVLEVPEQSVGKIQKGQKVDFTVDAFAGRRFTGKIKLISPALDSQTRTLVVEAEVPNKDRVLKPGLFASAQVELKEDRKGIKVPAEAVRRNDDIAQVFVVDQGIARARMVVAGEARQGQVEIMAGLKDGEPIVDNASQVEDGVRIQ